MSTWYISTSRHLRWYLQKNRKICYADNSWQCISYSIDAEIDQKSAIMKQPSQPRHNCTHLHSNRWTSRAFISRNLKSAIIQHQKNQMTDSDQMMRSKMWVHYPQVNITRFLKFRIVHAGECGIADIVCLAVAKPNGLHQPVFRGGMQSHLLDIFNHM